MSERDIINTNIPPTQLIKDRYVPLDEIEERYGYNEENVRKLIANKTIKYAEFIKPGNYKRTTHVNLDEVSKNLRRKKGYSDEH